MSLTRWLVFLSALMGVIHFACSEELASMPDAGPDASGETDADQGGDDGDAGDEIDDDRIDGGDEDQPDAGDGEPGDGDGDEPDDGDAGGDGELDGGDGELDGGDGELDGGDGELDGGDGELDGGDGGVDGGDQPLTAAECWAHKANPDLPGPEYDQFNPVIGSHCLGTNHQDIDGIELVVFLGDSVTAGTPPTPWSGYYRNLLHGMLGDRFGDVEVRNCSAYGARTDDLLLPSNQQILTCFSSLPEPKRTLVVMTVGGNDFFNMAEAFNAGATAQEIMDMAVEAVRLFEEAIHWFYDDPSRFPNGVFVTYSNVYEYTDGTGNMSSCPSCLLVGLCGNWPEGRAPAIYLNEAYMRIAVETGTDMIFLLEHFCGHGWAYWDTESQCYEEGSERWLDITCIHPTAVGHQEIANMFISVVDE